MMVPTAKKQPQFKTAWQVRRDHVAKFSRMAKASFAGHHIVMRLNNGMFRSWRCQPYQSWCYGFDITTMPGTLVVTGDIGDLIVERTNNMLAWARSSIHDEHYFAEKVSRAIPTKEYSQEVAQAIIREWFFDLRDNYGNGAADTYRDMLDRGWSRASLLENTETEREFYEAIIDSGMYEGCDMPDPTIWNSNFLWCRAAVAWFLERELVDYVI